MPGRAPGTSMMSPPIDIHPTWFAEKSGETAFCCAAAGTIGVAHIRPTRILPANACPLWLDGNMVAPPPASPSAIKLRQVPALGKLISPQDRARPSVLFPTLESHCRHRPA